MVNREEFEEWLENPITRAFRKAMQGYADKTEGQFFDKAWGLNFLTQEQRMALVRLKARSDLATVVAEFTFDDYEEFSRI